MMLEKIGGARFMWGHVREIRKHRNSGYHSPHELHGMKVPKEWTLALKAGIVCAPVAVLTTRVHLVHCTQRSMVQSTGDDRMKPKVSRTVPFTLTLSRTPLGRARCTLL